MNFAIRYLSRYAYDAEVTDNLNSLRVKPASGSRQRCDEFSLTLAPETRLHRHVDYFGTEVVDFEVSRPHTSLTIDARSRVSMAAPRDPPQAPWEAVAATSYREAGGEFLLQTDEADAQDAVAALLAGTGEPETPLAMLLAISELIPDRFEYRAGVTYVDSPVSRLFEVGAGVCQDFVHLGLSMLRARGVAARYVSGYLFAVSDDGGTESIEVDTHAWLEALLPVEGGGEPVWVGADPTNRGLAHHHHVKIGHGRHYSDVPPIKGVYRGAARAAIDARVTMTRLADMDPASIARA